MQDQNYEENPRRGLRAAIVVLVIILVLIICYFGYWILYPYISKMIFVSDETIKTNQEIASKIKDKDTGYIRAITDKMIKLTNDEREKAGLKPLKTDDKLITVAEYKVLEMATKNYFEHDSPEYGRIDNQFLKFGGIRLNIDALVIGENIAMFQNYPKNAITPDLIITAWMNSPEHKENILKEEYNEIGISVYYTSDGRCYASQEFMQAK